MQEGLSLVYLGGETAPAEQSAKATDRNHLCRLVLAKKQGQVATSLESRR